MPTRDCSHDKCDERQTQWMRKESAIAAFTFRKRAKEICKFVCEKKPAKRGSRQVESRSCTFSKSQLADRDAKRFAIRRCAVELTGRNSVSPSTIPKRTDNR